VTSKIIAFLKSSFETLLQDLDEHLRKPMIISKALHRTSLTSPIGWTMETDLGLIVIDNHTVQEEQSAHSFTMTIPI